MSEYKYKKNNEEKTLSRFPVGAFISINVIATIELLGHPELDIPLNISLYCFAASIPLLSAAFMNLVNESKHDYSINRWYEKNTLFYGCLISFVGISSLFYHYSWLIGLIFIISSIFSLCVSLSFYDALKKANRKESKNESFNE